MSKVNEGAFPFIGRWIKGHDPKWEATVYDADDYASGLSKREMFAAMAMQGLCACPQNAHEDADILARWAVGCADALLAELTKEPTP